jgi:tetratricopeptide (TPR) repeat protein
MKTNNIFQTLIRVLFVVFIFFLALNLNNSTNSANNYIEKINNLQIENVSVSNTSWLSIDQKLVKKHLEHELSNLQNSNLQQFKNNIKTSKFLIADENKSPLFLELEKTEKALENVYLLQIKLKSMPFQNQKFIKLVRKENPDLIGSLVEENNDIISIKDTTGFTTPIIKKNIDSIHILDQKEKTLICTNLLTKLLEDNGKSSYGLYLSAKWAYQNDLQIMSESILIEASLNDPKILTTIDECDAKILLNNALLSNLNGDYEIAIENAMKIISTFPNTSLVNEAKKILIDINNNIESHRPNNISAYEETPPIKTIAATEKNNLTIKKQTTGEAHEKSVSKQNSSPEKEIVEEKDSIKTPNLNKGLYQEKKYQEAANLIEQGSTLLKFGMSIDNPGSKKAQMNFKNALIKFETAKKLLVNINKKYEGNKDLEALNKIANEMHFLLNKNLIRLQ